MMTPVTLADILANARDLAGVYLMLAALVGMALMPWEVWDPSSENLEESDE